MRRGGPSGLRDRGGRPGTPPYYGWGGPIVFGTGGGGGTPRAGLVGAEDPLLPLSPPPALELVLSPHPNVYHPSIEEYAQYVGCLNERITFDNNPVHAGGGIHPVNPCSSGPGERV